MSFRMNVRINGQYEADSVVIEKVKIGKIETKLEITHTYSGGEESGILLDFECGYQIQIDGRGLSLQRVVNRPNHDHCNIERLVRGPKMITDRVLVWEDTDHRSTSNPPLFIEFGPRTVDW